jgi:hypothetical protein
MQMKQQLHKHYVQLHKHYVQLHWWHWSNNFFVRLFLMNEEKNIRDTSHTE